MLILLKLYKIVLFVWQAFSTLQFRILTLNPFKAMRFSFYCYTKTRLIIFASVVLVAGYSCSNTKHEPKEVEIVAVPEDLDKVVNERIPEILQYVSENNGVLSDSITLRLIASAKRWYEEKQPLRTWSAEKKWHALADSVYSFIGRSEAYGLFPSDYHWKELRHSFEKLKSDSATKLDAALWSRADVMLTDAFMQLVKDLRLGRLEKDSITTRKNLSISDSAYIALLNRAFETGNITAILEEQEPRLTAYQELRGAVKSFVDSMDRKPYTYISYFPIEIPEDSARYLQQLQARLYEGGYIAFNDRKADTAELAAAVRTYQEEKKLKVDGKAGPMVIRSLNSTDSEKFVRLAINLDRYKLMTDTLPKTYAWVNIPSFQLKVWEDDTVRIESKVIVGRPATRTPVLTSTLTNYIIFPQWTVPYSIIFNEMLPKIQKNIGYLDKENLMVVDKNDSIIDPNEINWFKLSKHNFPYLLKQRQGDDNSLGVIKFNFSNKYSVYLHDTNARSLFARSDRALSHGCVRVQKWDTLSRFLVQNDTLKYKPDSLAAWMARKEKRTVYFSRKTPLFIRYFTCEAKEGSVIFYEDLYAEDRIARNKYFANKVW